MGPIMSNRRRTVQPATTPIRPGEGSYPDMRVFLEETENETLAQDLIEKINASGLLVYALYSHPRAVDLFSSPLMTPALLKAYMAAAKAWGL